LKVLIKYILAIIKDLRIFINYRYIFFEISYWYIIGNIDNNVKLHGFYKFAYLIRNGTKLLKYFNYHYQYCNIVCINKNT